MNSIYLQKMAKWLSFICIILVFGLAIGKLANDAVDAGVSRMDEFSRSIPR